LNLSLEYELPEISPPYPKEFNYPVSIPKETISGLYTGRIIATGGGITKKIQQLPEFRMLVFLQQLLFFSQQLLCQEKTGSETTNLGGFFYLDLALFFFSAFSLS